MAGFRSVAAYFILGLPSPLRPLAANPIAISGHARPHNSITVALAETPLPRLPSSRLESMPAPVSVPPLFPAYAPSAILAFQFSSWYPTFRQHTIKSTVIRPLSADFREYLDSDGVFVPDGAEDLSVLCAYTS